MALKVYQPQRPEFLINTEWGRPSAPGKESGSGGSGAGLLFEGRWVTPEERDRLRDELAAYRSLRVSAWLLLIWGAMLALFVLGGIGDPEVKMTPAEGFVCGLGAVATLTPGFWLRRFRPLAAPAIRALVIGCGLVLVSVALWARTGLVDWARFERRQPALAALLAVAAITLALGGIAWLCARRPLARRILEPGGGD